LRVGKVLKLFIAPKGTSGVRLEQDNLTLIKDYGVKGDKFAASKDSNRVVMIVGTKPYQMAKDNAIELPTSALGENILLDFDPHTLNSGDRLKIGTAVIEITKSCTLCKHLTKYSPKLPKLILKHRGVYCRVIESGEINSKDDVFLIDRVRESA
jgi:MOSC domain-containing protein YiiM